MDDIDRWVELVAGELGVSAPEDIEGLLAISKDVAHQVARPATPLTTYVIGAAVASGTDMAQIRGVLRRCLDQWAEANPRPGS